MVLCHDPITLTTTHHSLLRPTPTPPSPHPNPTNPPANHSFKPPPILITTTYNRTHSPYTHTPSLNDPLTQCRRHSFIFFTPILSLSRSRKSRLGTSVRVTMPGQPRWWRQRIRHLLLPLAIFAFISFVPSFTSAWPYVDCSGTKPLFDLGAVTAYLDPSNTNVYLSLQGNFSKQASLGGFFARPLTNECKANRGSDSLADAVVSSSLSLPPSLPTPTRHLLHIVIAPSYPQDQQ